MPGQAPVLTVSPAPPLSPQDLHDKKRAAAETAMVDLGKCSPIFKIEFTDARALEPMALAAALMLLIEHGQCPMVNYTRGKQALSDYMMVWRRADWERPAA